MTNQFKGTIFILITVLFWGISYVSAEYLLAFLGPMTIGAFRFVTATLLLTIVMRFRKEKEKVRKEDKKLLALAGAIGISVYFFFESTGISYISASPAALIIAAIPMFTLIFEVIIFKRPYDWMDVVAILISIVGVIFVMDLKFDREAFASGDSKQWIGYLMMFGAVLSWVVYSMASRPLFKKYSYLTIVYHQFLYSLPYFILLVPFENNQWDQVDSLAVGHLLFLAIFASVIAFYCYAQSMGLLGVTESSVYINFLPVVTIVFSFFYTGQWIGRTQMLGGALIISSLMFSHVKEKLKLKRLSTEQC